MVMEMATEVDKNLYAQSEKNLHIFIYFLFID